MRKPKQKTKQNKIITGLHQALKMAASRVRVQPNFDPSQVLCVGGKAIVTDNDGRPWLLDTESETIRPMSAVTWQVTERS